MTLEDLLRTRIDALCDEIVADLGRWPEDRIGVIAVQRPNAGEVALFRDQERGTQTKVRAIADSIADILQGGDVELDHEQRVDAPPIFHSPTELTRMARLVKGLLGEGSLGEAPGVDFEVALGDPAQESRLRLLEFVARLPTLAARAGFLPHRPADASNDLSEGQIQTLAMGAHENYTATAQKTGNATLSGNWTRRWSELDTVEQHSNLAQIFDAPVKLAMVHLTWRRAEDPQLHEFTNDEIELLAELEHRRWHHFQLRNGRPGHLWAVPWAGMEESVKDYDRDAVRGLPALLADAGLEIVSEPGSS